MNTTMYNLAKVDKVEAPTVENREDREELTLNERTNAEIIRVHRRRDIEEKRTLAPLKTLRPHHRSMARDVAAGGLRNRELAKLYNMTRGMISKIVTSPIFIAEVARIEADVEERAIEVREEIRMIAPRARMILAKTLASEVEDLKEHLSARRFQTGVAQDILDRSGAGKSADGGGGIHLHLSKTEEKHIHLMSDKEIRDDLFDILKEGE